MQVLIKNNSDGYTTEVTPEGQLKVEAEIHELQHHEARVQEQTYQVIGTATIANATTTVLHLKNNDPERDMVVSSIRLQSIDPSGGTAPPAAANFFSIGYDRTISSGGSAVTPVNTNAASGKVAAGTFTDSGPTMTGTFKELDRWYLDSDGGTNTFNNQGSLILKINDTLEIRFTSDNTSGTAYARVTFMMIGEDE